MSLVSVAVASRVTEVLGSNPTSCTSNELAIVVRVGAWIVPVASSEEKVAKQPAVDVVAIAVAVNTPRRVGIQLVC